MTQEHIVFGATLVEIRQMLEKLKNMNIDVSKLEARVNVVEQQVNKEIDTVQQQYESQENLNTLLKDGYFAGIYQKGIKQLVMIQNYLLEEFNIYYKIYGKYQYIISGINQISKDNINTFVADTKTLLTQINNTPNMDYSMEKTLVENIYSLVFQIIKKEFQLTGKSNLLSILTESDISYIEMYLLKEIESLSLESSSEISRKLKEIESTGLNVDYLQEDLLRLLWNDENGNIVESAEDSSSMIEKKKYLEEIRIREEQIQLCSKIEQKIEQQSKQIKDTSLEIKEKRSRILKNRLFLAGYISAYLGIGAGSFLLIKEAFKEKHYYVKEETYQENGEISEDYYYDLDEDSVTILKYYPYEELGFWDSVPKGEDTNSKFVRKIESYDVSEIDFDNLEEYLTLDLVSLGVESTDTKDYKVYLTPQDTYQESYTLVKRTTHDLDNYKEVVNKVDLWFCFLLAMSFVTGFFVKGFISDGYLLNWITEIKEKKQDKKELIKI